MRAPDEGVALRIVCGCTGVDLPQRVRAQASQLARSKYRLQDGCGGSHRSNRLR